MTKWTDLILVDTNVLVAAFMSEDELTTSVAMNLLDRAQDGKLNLCVAPQVLGEFYAVITNHRRVSVPFTPVEAIDALQRLLIMPGMTVLPIPADFSIHWLELLQRRLVKGGDVFDVQIIAVMLSNRVRKMYTFNRKDFEPFEEIEVLAL